MRFFLLLFSCGFVNGLGFWRALGGGFFDHDGGLENNVEVTGRVFVTLLGFPAKCRRSGESHACTLSLACWMVGGSSQSGCGGNPWLVACCVTNKEYAEANLLQYQDFNIQDLELNHDVPPVAVLQKRTDENIEEECGISSDRLFQKRIIGGNIAKFGQYPWQVYIKIGTYQCGGVLVSRRYVATAAHCIISAKLTDILVYLGELDTQDTGEVSEFAPAELHRVRRKLIHPKFQFRTTQPDRYDLALLELITETTFGFYILPICLPQNDIELKGRSAVVAGWGKTIPSKELMGTHILRSATVPVLDYKECMAWHHLKQISVELHEDMLCAGHKNGRQDACLGDSGGPLIVLEKGKWTLIGITSAGFGCGEPNQPGIYHKIPKTADWIKEIVYNH